MVGALHATPVQQPFNARTTNMQRPYNNHSTSVNISDSVRIYLYESTCTFFTARPDGSILFLNDASHASASAVLQATEGTEGTHDAAESDGKCSENIVL